MKRVLPSVMVVAGLILVFQVGLTAFHVPEIFVPLPSTVFTLIVSSKIPWLTHVYVTLFEATAGFGLAIAFGIPVALIIYISKTLRAAVEPILLAVQVTPKVAIIPVLFLWLGISPLPRIITVFLVCFFPIVIDTMTGLSSVDRDLVELVKLYTPSTVQLITKVSLPSALPSIFSGLKISITLAFVGAVVAEFVSSSYGLGFLILSAEANIDTPLAFASITILIALSLVAYGAITLTEWLVVTRRR